MRHWCRLLEAAPLGVVLVSLLWITTAAAEGSRQLVPYSTFINDMHAHRVKKATVSGSEIDATLDNGETVATIPVPAGIAAELQRYGAEYAGKLPSDSTP